MDIPANIIMSSGYVTYVAVKASIHASDSAVFGLNEEEINALSKKFNNGVRKDVINGVLLKTPPIILVNALGQLGYKVICTTGEAETLDELEFERGIWYAAQNGDLQRIKKLLSQGTNVDKRDSAGYTALHYAARAGHDEICNFLLNNGADINAATRSGKATALHRAALAGKYPIVQLLLNRNADVMLKDGDGKTVLHRAAEAQSLAICQDIVKICPSLRNEVDNKGRVAFDYIKNPQLAAALSLKIL